MKQILSIVFMTCFLTSLQGVIISTPHLDLFGKAVECADEKSLVLFDVDETLLMPKDRILHPHFRDAFYCYAKQYILEQKKHNLSFLRSKVFADMEFCLVDPAVLALLSSLQQRSMTTLAFTAMMTGPFGVIPNMEEWRIDQLARLGVDFSAALPLYPELKIEVHPGQYALFKQGILFANKYEKGPVLVAFLRSLDWKPEKIFFLDNSLDYLCSVEKALEGTGIAFFGYHYTEVEEHPPQINKKLAQYQIQYLVSHGEWLSDEKAVKKMENEQMDDSQHQKDDAFVVSF